MAASLRACPIRNQESERGRRRRGRRRRRREGGGPGHVWDGGMDEGGGGLINSVTAVQTLTSVLPPPTSQQALHCHGKTSITSSSLPLHLLLHLLFSSFCLSSPLSVTLFFPLLNHLTSSPLNCGKTGKTVLLFSSSTTPFLSPQSSITSSPLLIFSPSLFSSPEAATWLHFPL